MEVDGAGLKHVPERYWVSSFFFWSDCNMPFAIFCMRMIGFLGEGGGSKVKGMSQSLLSFFPPVMITLLCFMMFT